MSLLQRRLMSEPATAISSPLQWLVSLLRWPKNECFRFFTSQPIPRRRWTYYTTAAIREQTAWRVVERTCYTPNQRPSSQPPLPPMILLQTIKTDRLRTWKVESEKFESEHVRETEMNLLCSCPTPVSIHLGYDIILLTILIHNINQNMSCHLLI